jgi:hypothetical protein
MLLPIDTTALRFLLTGEPTAVLDYQTRLPRTDAAGRPLLRMPAVVTGTGEKRAGGRGDRPRPAPRGRARQPRCLHRPRAADLVGPGHRRPRAQRKQPARRRDGPGVSLLLRGLSRVAAPQLLWPTAAREVGLLGTRAVGCAPPPSAGLSPCASAHRRPRPSSMPTRSRWPPPSASLASGSLPTRSAPTVRPSRWTCARRSEPSPTPRTVAWCGFPGRAPPQSPWASTRTARRSACLCTGRACWSPVVRALGSPRRCARCWPTSPGTARPPLPLDGVSSACRPGPTAGPTTALPTRPDALRGARPDDARPPGPLDLKGES